MPELPSASASGREPPGAGTRVHGLADTLDFGLAPKTREGLHAYTRATSEFRRVLEAGPGATFICPCVYFLFFILI